MLDAVASEHNTALSIGSKINAAGSAADPLLNDPDDYAEGTAGKALANIAQIKTQGTKKTEYFHHFFGTAYGAATTVIREIQLTKLGNQRAPNHRRMKVRCALTSFIG